MDLWLYHEKDAPNGELLRGVTDAEIKSREKAGWTDTPANFKKPVDEDAAPAKENPEPRPAVKPLLQLEAMTDGEVVIAIDDMDRATVEKHLWSRSIDLGGAQTTSQLRGLLLAHVKPGAQSLMGQQNDIEPAPPATTRTSEQEQQLVSLAALKDMEPDARNARIEALTDDQLDEALKAANVQVKRNATIAAKRAGLKAYFS